MTDSATHDIVLVPGTHATIQGAIDAAVGPTTIVVSPGVYAESLSVRAKEYIVIQSARLSRRGVTLTGEGGAPVIAVDRAALYLSGIEIRSRGASRGIVAVDAKISLQECVVAGNRAGHGDEPFGAGMWCRRSTVHLQKSGVSANTIDAGAAALAGGAGIHLQDCRAEIAGCTIQLNEILGGVVARGGGIWCERTKLRMWRSRVTDNALRGALCEGGGICFVEPADAQLGGSVITGNDAGEGRGGGIFIESGGAAVAIHRNSFVRQNNPDDVAGGDVRTAGRA